MLTHPTPDPIAPPPDALAELVAAAQAGDRAAFSAIIDRFEALVRGSALRVTRSPEDADDAAQQTWMIFVQKVGTIRTAQALPAWLVTTARREALRLVRERYRAIPLEDAALDRMADPGDGPEAQVVQLDLDDRVREALGRLPEQRARLLIQVVAQRRPYLEVSVALGCPVGSLGPLRARYLRQLAVELEQAGATVA